ncbi:MAG: NAD-dependent dihydropyrimidine dehydrogenase subunit PreA, partial [Myxococcota bacterium]
FMAIDLRIIVNDMLFDNPFVIGSGPPSTNARVIAKAFDAGWGGVVAKTTSLTDTEVINVTPRYGKLRSPKGDVIGFQNIELISDRPFEDWEEDFRQLKKEYPKKILIASIMESFEQARWVELAKRCAATGVDALELNFSCPHGHPERGMGAAMGQDPHQVETVTRWVVDAVDIPVWAKMTPNITDIAMPARAAHEGGAHGISAINTILSVIGINLKTLRPMPTVEGESVPGGYSALAVKPIALRMVRELAVALPGLPISAIGGVTCAVDAIEHILVGGSTVQSCTGPMLHGLDMVSELRDGLSRFLTDHKFNSVQDAVGKSLPYFSSHHHLVELQAKRREEKAAARAGTDLRWGETGIQDVTNELTSNH